MKLSKLEELTIAAQQEFSQDEKIINRDFATGSPAKPPRFFALNEKNNDSQYLASNHRFRGELKFPDMK